MGTEYLLHQVKGKSAALSIATGVEPDVIYAQHDGAEGTDGLGKDAPKKRVGLHINNTDPNPDGTNTGIVVTCANAPHGNFGVLARVQYAPEVTPPIQQVILQEVDSADMVLHERIVSS